MAGIRKELSPEIQRPNWGFRGAVGIHSTPRDLFAWYQALRADRILSPASRQRLLAPHAALEGGEQAAYGWFHSRTRQGTAALWTRGTEDFGHNAILMVYPAEKVMIAAASNAGEREGVAITRRLAEDLAALIFSKPTYSGSPPTT